MGDSHCRDSSIHRGTPRIGPVLQSGSISIGGNQFFPVSPGGSGFYSELSLLYCTGDENIPIPVPQSDGVQPESRLGPDHLQCLLQSVYSQGDDGCCRHLCTDCFVLSMLELLGFPKPSHPGNPYGLLIRLPTPF